MLYSLKIFNFANNKKSSILLWRNEKMQSKSIFIFIRVLYIFYLITWLYLIIHIQYLSKISWNYKILFISILIILSPDPSILSKNFYSYFKYKELWEKENTPNAHSYKGFLILDFVIDKNNLCSHGNLFWECLNIILNYFNIKENIWHLAKYQNGQYIKGKKFNKNLFIKSLTIQNSKLEKIFIYKLFNLIFQINLFNNKDKKYNRLTIEIDLDYSSYMSEIEYYINKIIDFLCNNFSIIYGRIIFTHDRFILNRFYYYKSYENANNVVNHDDYENNFIDIDEIDIHNIIPKIYWGNIISDEHFRKLNDHKIKELEGIFYIVKKIKNIFYLQLTKSLAELDKPEIKNHIKIANNVLSSIICKNSYLKPYELRVNWEELVNSLK